MVIFLIEQFPHGDPLKRSATNLEDGRTDHKLIRNLMQKIPRL